MRGCSVKIVRCELVLESTWFDTGDRNELRPCSPLVATATPLKIEPDPNRVDADVLSNFGYIAGTDSKTHQICTRPLYPGGRFQEITSAYNDMTNENAATDVAVGIIMGSRSDWPTMQEAAAILDQLGVAHECEVVSAHRTPELMFDYARQAKSRGIQVIIAGAGGAAHLPGMVAAMTPLPVLGVPVQSKALNGLDSLLSIAQMPGGVPVGTLAIGASGAKNAGILAARILGLSDPVIAANIEAFMQQQTESVMKDRQL